jgi:hypothetical protein
LQRYRSGYCKPKLEINPFQIELEIKPFQIISWSIAQSRTRGYQFAAKPRTSKPEVTLFWISQPRARLDDKSIYCWGLILRLLIAEAKILELEICIYE